MTKPLNETLSVEIARRIGSQPGTPFENAYQAASILEGALYVQGFLVITSQAGKFLEHAWIELDECLVDPSWSHLKQAAQNLCYFPAQRLSLKQLKASVEEAQEDYPEDNPLPIYGAPPYEYYGEVMLGGKDYWNAYQLARERLQTLRDMSASQN